MTLKNRKFKKDKKNFNVVNKNIRAPKVLCINHKNENIGVISTREALKIAQDEGLDLVQVSPANRNTKFPTCKILDYGKYKYDQSKKNKSQAKKRRETTVKTKEIKFRPNTDTNDLITKSNMALKFLQEGNRVKIVVTFKGRELSHKDIAYEKMQHFFELIREFEIISSPNMDGRAMTALIGAKKNSNERRLAS